MKSDIDRWNAKYSNREYESEIKADPLVTQYHALLPDKGLALDLATGLGDNALTLATLGLETVAIDGSITALRLAKKKGDFHDLRVGWIVADLDLFPLPRDCFDVVTVLRYLNRPVIDDIRETVRCNGILLFSTFNENFGCQRPSFPKEYVLRSGELSEWFFDWECIDTNDREEAGSERTYWIGRKAVT